MHRAKEKPIPLFPTLYCVSYIQNVIQVAQVEMAPTKVVAHVIEDDDIQHLLPAQNLLQPPMVGLDALLADLDRQSHITYSDSLI